MAFRVGLRTTVKDGFKVQAHVFQALTTKIGKNSVEAAASNLGTLTRRAEARFNASTLRPGEKGVGSGGRRQTGNFTFGTKAGGSFTGTQFVTEEGLYGFGWPNIDKADALTNFVWRSLEFGLAGTRPNSRGQLRGPGHSRFPENAHLVPTGFHRMPRRFMFTSESPSNSYLFLNKSAPERMPPGGAGIEGKHFIEDAFIESIEIMAGRYKKAVLDPVASFGRG